MVGFPPKSSIFYRDFHYKPFILGYPHIFGNTHIELEHDCFQKGYGGWWLNQPIWKICSSKWVHLPQVGMKINKNWKPPPKWLFPKGMALVPLKIQKHIRRLGIVQLTIAESQSQWYCWWFRNSAHQLIWSFIPLFTGDFFHESTVVSKRDLLSSIFIFGFHVRLQNCNMFDNRNKLLTENCIFFAKSKIRLAKALEMTYQIISPRCDANIVSTTATGNMSQEKGRNMKELWHLTGWLPTPPPCLT